MQFETHPSNGVCCLLIILVNKGLDFFSFSKSVVLSDVCQMASDIILIMSRTPLKRCITFTHLKC